MLKKIVLAASTALVLVGSGMTPASAPQVRYCLQGRIWGYPGNCRFATYQQCMATASGTHAYCGVNPAYGYERPVPRPYRY